MSSFIGKIQNGGFSEGGSSNNRFVLKPDVAIASEVSILSKNSLAITDFNAKKAQRVQLFENPLPGTPPFAIPNFNDVTHWFDCASALQIGGPRDGRVGRGVSHVKVWGIFARACPSNLS